MKRFSIALLTVLVIVSFFQVPMVKAEDTIKIGALYPFTGPLAFLGRAAWMGLKIIAEKVNNEGGIHGKQIQLVKGDAATQESAISECERLIVIEKCKAIVGTISSARSMVSTAVAERHAIPYFEDSAISTRITARGFKYLFRLPIMASDVGIGAARYMAEVVAPSLGINASDLKVAVINESGELGSMIAKKLVDEAKILGMKVVASESFKVFSRDMSDIVLRLKNAGPDVLFVASYSPDVATLWRQSRELDFNVKAIFSNEALDKMLPKNFGDQINGVFTTYAPIRGINVEGLKPDAAKAYRYFFSTLKKDYPGSVFHSTELNSYLTGQILFEKILPKVSSFDAEAIRKAALEVNIPKGGTVLCYGVKFAPPGHPMAGQNLRAFTGVMQWQNQKIYTVWPEKFASRKPILLPMPSWKEREK